MPAQAKAWQNGCKAMRAPARNISFYVSPASTRGIWRRLRRFAPTLIDQSDTFLGIPGMEHDPSHEIGAVLQHGVRFGYLGGEPLSWSAWSFLTSRTPPAENWPS